MEYGGVVGLLIVIVIFLIVSLLYLLTTGEYRLGRWREARMAFQQEADQREPKNKKANRTALLAYLLKGPVVIASALAALLRLPVTRYRDHRLETEKTKQAAAEQKAEQERLWSEMVEQAAAQREAERQHREAKKTRQAALRAEQRKREQYWESLGGIEFEQELGRLYRDRGYDVRMTPTSGDQGIDLILRKNGKTTVVQCKAQKRPASPNVIRDLYGSMLHHKADNAILACTGGFSGNVVKFARGKPIRLIDSRDITRMAEESGSATKGIAVDTPICPKDGCERTMVLRNSRHGTEFWGCPRYPACRGTRDF